ncbi:16203_t:CDS:2, partial [Cetraspora pellucida]
MEQTLYFNFLNYLTTSELPSNLTLKEQQQFKKQTTHYIIENNQLYRKPKRSLQKLLHVVQESKLLTILHGLHSDILARYYVDALCQLIKIKHQFAFAYHSQTNGLTKRFNKTLYTILAKQKAITLLDLVLNSTTNAKELHYEQQLQ